MGIITQLYGGVVRTQEESAVSLYDFIKPYPDLWAEFQGYIGKPLLIVNTASRCGFTPQYDALEQLHEERLSQGLLVLGFPSNDFMGQEPGSDQEIESFCRINFGVTFKLFPKGAVKGPHKQPVFRFLTECGPRSLRGKVRWNFEKFLVDERGYLVGRWRSYVSPRSRGIRHAIDQLLNRGASAPLA